MQAFDDFDPVIGVAEELEKGLRRIVAPNPSPMTYKGTNTYILGAKDLAVIDPGPDSAEHLEAILSCLEPQQRVTHIIVTHSHQDHSPLARALSKATGAPVLAFGDSTAGRSEVMRSLAETGYQGGGEGVDHAFTPDRVVTDGQSFFGSGWTLKVMHAPGHMGNHICLKWKDCCFTADHVMGWASSLVSPPDGDLTDFMTSCDELAANQWRAFYPGHGDVIRSPNDRLEWLINHRQEREASVLRALKDGPMSVSDLTRIIYADTPIHLHAAAQRNVFAHLIDLHQKNIVRQSGRLDPDKVFERIA